jgi:hypothetical protein
MTSESTAKRCLLCGAMVPPNAVKCTACGKGRFETVKRHAEDRPKPGTGASRPSTAAPPAGRAVPGGSSRTAAPNPPSAPRRGLLPRLFSRLTGRD